MNIIVTVKFAYLNFLYNYARTCNKYETNRIFETSFFKLKLKFNERMLNKTY